MFKIFSQLKGFSLHSFSCNFCGDNFTSDFNGYSFGNGGICFGNGNGIGTPLPYGLGDGEGNGDGDGVGFGNGLKNGDGENTCYQIVINKDA